MSRASRESYHSDYTVIKVCATMREDVRHPIPSEEKQEDQHTNCQHSSTVLSMVL